MAIRELAALRNCVKYVEHILTDVALHRREELTTARPVEIGGAFAISVGMDVINLGIRISYKLISLL